MLFVCCAHRLGFLHLYQAADGGDVSQLLFVGQHVGAQRVHDGLHLVLLHLAHQRAQAAAKRTTFIRSDDKESVQVAREEKTRER